MSRIKNPWGDGRDVHVRDAACDLRPCLHVGEDKGSYTPGVGYTSYRSNPPLVCMTRHCRGCPDVIPEPEAERARCCPAPTFPKVRPGKNPAYQTCQVCGTRSGGLRLELARALPNGPASTCDHASAVEIVWGGNEQAWRCGVCRALWDERPKPHHPGETHEAFAKRRHEAWRARMEELGALASGALSIQADAQMRAVEAQDASRSEP